MSSGSGVWGPRGGPPAYLYRAMRGDLRDVFPDYASRDWDIMSLSSESPAMRLHVLQSLTVGGFNASPLLHFTKSWDCALTWRELARAEQNEMGCGQYIVRLDMTRFSADCDKRGTPVQARVIDLSDQAAQNRFFTPGPEGQGGHFPSLCMSLVSVSLQKAIRDQEVLVKWRGTIPLPLLEVVHIGTGEPTGDTAADMLPSDPARALETDVLSPTPLQKLLLHAKPDLA